MSIERFKGWAGQLICVVAALMVSTATARNDIEDPAPLRACGTASPSMATGTATGAAHGTSTRRPDGGGSGTTTSRSAPPVRAISNTRCTSRRWTAACYDAGTGRCYTCFEGDCPPTSQWPGPGTACPDTPSPQPEFAPVFRPWSTARSLHFYTTDETARDRLLADPAGAWIDEGTAWQALTTGDGPDCLPVYRFRSSVLGVCFFTISENKRQGLTDRWACVWRYEGVAFYAYPEGRQPPGTVPVYRFWSGALGHHFYTVSDAERDGLIRDWPQVWLYEGAAWYAYPP